MTDLVILMLAAIALAWCADHMGFGPADSEKRHRLILCSIVIFILLAGLAGLRTHCNDTGAYRHGYELITESSWKESDKSIGANPLFNWVNYQLKVHGVSTQNFLMFWAVLTVGCYVIFVHHYSVNYPLTVFLLFTTALWGIYGFLTGLILILVSMATTPTFGGMSYLWPLFPFNKNALNRLLFRCSTPSAQPCKVWNRGNPHRKKSKKVPPDI